MASPSIFADPRTALQQARKLLDKDPERAASQARAILSGEPNNPKALLLLGRSLRALGKGKEAAEAERKAIAAGTRDPRHAAAAQAIQRGDGMRANTLLQQLLHDDKEDPLAAIMFGMQASRAGEVALADELLERAVRLVPSDPGARMTYADHLQRNKRFIEAIEQLDLLPSPDNKSETALSLRAACLGETGRADEELALLKKLQAKSKHPELYLPRIGLAQRTLGQSEAAEKTFRSVLKIQPADGTSWHNLSNLKTVRFSDDDMAAMKKGLKLKNAPVTNAIRIHNALGKAYEERGDAERAFHHYGECNRLRASIAPHDPEMISQWVERCKKAYTPEFFEKRDGWGCKSRDPIFIIGMQRSGSTLVEQVLASHPEIEGTSELTELQNVVREHGKLATAKGQLFEQELAKYDEAKVEAIGKTYLDAASRHRRTDKPLFTDKMPNNWMHVGLIRLALPNAKIIDVRRDPMDCCFSNWKQLYGKGLDHSNALDTMAQYYNDYVELMRHFDEVQPGAIHRIIYENLVDDLECEVRRLLDYVEVDYDSACLDFHKSDRAVHTISAGQVRQPINRKGIGAYRPFAEWLGALEEELGDTKENWKQ